MNPIESEQKPYAIVVGIDYSELSNLALERACDLAAAHQRTHIHVIHVESAQASSSYGIHSFGTQGEAKTTDLNQTSTRLHDHVEEIVRRWCIANSREPAFERLTTHIGTQPAADEIAQLAADVEAELIVIGTHGRRGARRFLLGSVAEGTVRLAACDVLVVRPPDATIPKIEPLCPRCADTRRATNSRELWCEQHSEHHESAHTYHYSPPARGHQSGLLIYAE
jgi:nucleotide-binding universal stress UspA family protein